MLPESITSLNNPRVKKALRLHQSRGRVTQGRFIVFGDREVRRAIEAGIAIDELFVADVVNDQEIELIQSESKGPINLFRLSDDVFAKLAYGDRTERLIATAFRPTTKLNNLPLDSSLVLVLQSIEKPGNLGAIIRSADGAGVSAVILTDPITDIFHPNSIRSSTGAVFSMPIATCSTLDSQAWLLENQFRIHTAILDSAIDFFAADFTGKIAIVLGNETRGLDGQWTSKEFTAVKLPMKGRADSLNVSVTASIMCYEAMRQRRNS